MYTVRLLALCFVLVAGLFGSALGQADEALRFGATGGLAAGSFWNEHSEGVFSYGPRVDGQLGAWLHLRRSGPVDVQVGVMVARQGAFQEFTPPNEQVETAYYELSQRLTYVRVPILARLPVGLPLVDAKLHLLGGPHAALLLRAESRVDSEVFRPPVGGPGFHPFDAGVTVGAELPIAGIGPVDWAITTRYSLGLLPNGRRSVDVTEVEVDRQPTAESESSLRNHLLTLGITTWW